MKQSAPNRAMIFALCLIALAACAKVEEPIDQEPAIQNEPAPATHSVQVFIDKADDTKTSVVEGQDGASYIWTEGDEQYLHVYENGVEGQITGIQFSQDYTSAALTVTFSGTPAAPYTYTAKYAKTIGEGGNPVIRADQKPTSSSYDPAADVMISRADADVTNLSARANEVSFTMGRVVSVNRMMLTGLVAGEKVSKVEFTLGKNFVGSLYEGNETYTGGSGKLTATYDTPLAVNALGQFPVYFTCAPVDGASIESVVVTTDQNVYTKSGSAFSGKSISFAVGTMKRFNMGMNGCGTPVPAGNIYTLVQNKSGLVSGALYLIVGNSSQTSKYYALGEQRTNNRAGVEVTVDSGTITLDNNNGAYPVVIETTTGGYTLKAGNKYLYTDDTSANRLYSRDNIEDNNAVWTVSVTNGVATIQNVGNTSRGKLCFNSNWQSGKGDTNPLFAGYSSAPQNSTASLALYVNLSSSVPSLSTPTNLIAVNNNGNVHVEWDAVSGAASYTVTCTGQTAKTGITTTSTDFTGLSAGTYTITVKAISADQSVNLDSEAASTEVTVTVTSPKGSEENPYTASEAIAETSSLPSNTNSAEVYVTGIISNVASYNSTYSSISYYISDDGTTTNQFYIYSGKGLNGADFSSKNDLAVGWKVVLKGKLRNYNGNTPELYYDNVIISLLKPATATVTTGSATSIGSTQVTLNGSYAGASGQIYETGFYYGTSQNSLTESVTTDGSNAASGNFSCSVTGLAEGTTYYYKAYVLEFNAITGQYEERLGSSVGSFTTTSASANVAPGYLGCYEVPSIPTLSGTGTNGTLSSRGDKWFKYNTSSSKQKVVTHTFVNGQQVRNYTVMFDSDKHAPLWAAFPMHKNVYNGSTNRSDDWTYDPAGVTGEQTGLDNAQTVGYSRGHLVASQYRKYSDNSNLQTFYYTNQAPQWQNGFNSGVWSTMEDRLVTISPTSQNDTIYVVAGVLYEGTITTLPSGSINVPIPSHFYTCAMKCTFNSTGTITAAQGIAFVYTNESHTGEKYYSSSFVTSIDAIETRSGFEFFPNVPAGLQNAAEANTNHTWFTGQSSNNINDVTDDNWGTL